MKYLITGKPCSGKSSLMRALSTAGLDTSQETGQALLIEPSDMTEALKRIEDDAVVLVYVYAKEEDSRLSVMRSKGVELTDEAEYIKLEKKLDEACNGAFPFDDAIRGVRFVANDYQEMTLIIAAEQLVQNLRAHENLKTIIDESANTYGDIEATEDGNIRTEDADGMRHTKSIEYAAVDFLSKPDVLCEILYQWLGHVNVTERTETAENIPS